MKTLLENYCAAHRCPEAEFQRRIFWRSLHLHARPVAWLLRRIAPDYFALEHELIDYVGLARNSRDLNEEIRDYHMDHRNQRWWRRVVRIRLSTHRLRSQVRIYLPARPSVPPFPARAENKHAAEDPSA